jgi:drug/metabolite transporter (DMT)-like permease
VDRKIILWSVALFFGCYILFGAINSLASSSGKGVSLAIQAGVLVAIVAVIVMIARRKK